MIDPDVAEALATLSFNPAHRPDDVWRASPYDVPQLHETVVAEILRGVNRARTGDDTSPVGVAMQGRAGSGKTHLLGAVRERIQRDGGYFFLVNLVNGKTFWESTAICMVESLDMDAIGWGSQLKTFLWRLVAELGLPVEVRDAVGGATAISRERLDTFIHGLRRFDGVVGRECQDTARALVLHGSLDFEAQDVGYAHLISQEGDPAGRAAWGISPVVRTPQQIVRDISRLIALTRSPSVIAIDQLDTLFAQTSTAFFERDGDVEEAHARTIAPVADGLLTLRDVTRRTLTVVSCLPDTWEILQRIAPSPVRDRFRVALLPDRIPTPEIGYAIIAKRFAARYDESHLRVKYPTWPVRPGAFDDAPDFTPRSLLRRVDRHIRWCLDHGEVVELDRLVDDGDSTQTEGLESVRRNTRPDPHEDLEAIDRRFADLVGGADVRGALDPKTEDAVVPSLLSAGLAAWIDEQAPTGATFKHDPPPSRKPALHARLIQVLDESVEDEAHVAFRAIASPNANAVIARLRTASTMAGLDREIPQRQLVVLRNGGWPNGKVTATVAAAFAAAGGTVHALTEHDLAVFAALAALRDDPPTGLQEWLLTRRPASNTELFRDVLGDPAADGVTAGPTPSDDTTTPTLSTPDEEPPDDGWIGLGRTIDRSEPFRLNLESLRRHTAIFAGSGSGKTVLIRRLVEECALRGVSAIVLDPNNDLARLGEAWPEEPAAWGPGDAARSREYLATTDVVIWTPRVRAGRPLAFQPLPDFAPVRDSPDEFDQAIHSAVEALAPRAGITGATRLAQQGKAVLTEALLAYANAGRVGLHGFADFLAELPEGVSRMAKGQKLAHDLSETLKAAMVTDPLFGGDGTPVDPGTLLTPAPGKRARVSVVSFVGLSSDAQRQSFVNQLQMALFAWIKRNPAGDRPLGGLFVMDEAQTLAPSTGNTPSTASSIALAAQARKYGLGLVFATQAPKGLHNQITGNATTQFFGVLNTVAQIDAARQLAQAKGGRLPDIGLLSSGEFYAAGEGFSFTKVRTPLCLTHHPKAPLSPEEVVARAAGRA